MAEYQLTATDAGVVRNADKAFIPNDPANRDWVEYQEWLAVPNTPDPYVAPPPPEPVPDANARLDAGIAAAVTTVVAAAAAVHAIPHGGAIPARFETLLVQMAITMDAFVAMLMAQSNTET